MIFRKLGEHGFPVSVLAFGAWQLGDPAYWGDDDNADADEVVGAAIDAGINLFDTAEMYGAGESERVLGAALRGRRDEVYVASKVAPENCEPEKLRTSCEASLRRLRTETIDLYQIHWPFRHVPFAEVYGELDTLRSEGKVRAIGVCNFGRVDLSSWMGDGECCSNQIGYNLLFRAAEYDMLPACRKLGVGVLAYMPLLQGILSGRYESVDQIPEKRRRTRHFNSHRPGTRHGESGCESELLAALHGLRALSEEVEADMATLALAWLLAQPEVTSVLVGARKGDQLRRNLRAAEIKLSANVLTRLTAMTHPLKQRLGTNPDMWDAGDAARIR